MIYTVRYYHLEIAHYLLCKYVSTPYKYKFDFVEEIATSTSSTMDNDHNSAQLDHNSKDFLRKSVESLFNKLYGMVNC